MEGMGIILALIIGWFAGSAGMYFTHPSIENSTHVIEKCEAELPRNQKCKIIAVIDEAVTL